MNELNNYSISDSGCWIWNGKKCSSGRYGYFYKNKKMNMAHRASYEFHNGEINNGLFVCHTCDNGLCINPNHLFLGDNSDNMRDAYSKGRSNLNERNKISFGVNNSNVKLSENDVLEIRDYYERTKCGCREISRKFNLKSDGHAYAIIKRKIWKHI